MTKKDYIKIADIFIEKKQWCLDHDEKIVYNSFLESVIAMLQKDNPKFNKETFINYITIYDKKRKNT